MIIEFYIKCLHCGFEKAFARRATKYVHLEIVCPQCKYSYLNTDFFKGMKDWKGFGDVFQETTIKYYPQNLQKLDALEFLKTVPVPPIPLKDGKTINNMFDIFMEEKFHRDLYKEGHPDEEV